MCRYTLEGFETQLDLIGIQPVASCGLRTMVVTASGIRNRRTLHHAPEAGLHFGFPFCHQGNIQDPEFNTRPCSEFRPPAQRLGPHVASLGMEFYTGEMFPDSYRDQIFIAEHGSWNRSPEAGHTGYRLMVARLDGNRVTGYDIFAEGWLEATNEAWGRPVDVEVMPDGALLVSDDSVGAIYRITYSN